MKRLHKGSQNIGTKVESKKGARGPLCSNKANVRAPFLDFIPNAPFVSEKMQLDYLADILVRIFLERKKHERQQKESSDLLPSIN